MTPTPPTMASSVDNEGLKAWQTLTKSGPVTQATFLAWYATQYKKTNIHAASSSSNSKPVTKKRKTLTVLHGAETSQQPTLTKGKRTALLKAITSSLKTSIKTKKTKWHAGDTDVKAGTAVMDANEFVALFPDVTMTKKGVTTSFSLTKETLTHTFGENKLNVQTWSISRNFQTAYKTGSQNVSLLSADGKYSTGTSTLTLKFTVSIGGGVSGIGGGWVDDGDY